MRPSYLKNSRTESECSLHALLFFLLAIFALPSWVVAQPNVAAPTEPPVAVSINEMPAADLREEIQRLSVTVKDMYGRVETKSITLTVFRPQGNGPFPLAIVNHGRATAINRPQQGRARYVALARYLVSKGFAVIAPTRVGYGETYGDFDPEDAGNCNVMRVAPMHLVIGDQVLATLAHAKTLPFIDTSRWIVLGQSLGGTTAVATAARKPEGLLGAINFAGGAGGDPETRPENPCLPSNLARHWHSLGAQSDVPMLWIYWENDKYWGADHPRRWLKAYVDGGGKAVLHLLPAVGSDGHNGINIDMNTWVPLMETYLANIGFTRSGLVPNSGASGFANLNEIEKVPTSTHNRENLYKRFLTSKLPRAFAIGANGAAGLATGDWAAGRALGYCQTRRGLPCKLYAIDNDVVWIP
jgi:dienelactone hydrolase